LLAHSRRSWTKRLSWGSREAEEEAPKEAQVGADQADSQSAGANRPGLHPPDSPRRASGSATNVNAVTLGLSASAASIDGAALCDGTGMCCFRAA
jgi:hypothetical protein